ncbi:hypothetical protein B0H16DRAFT_1445793 [Mycena metata]|uniref:Transmembrane protein n=1 Tax=Mycena metata TaxID=1033252 RepID=A0AAD7KHE3_9AGAR|nr:hypothetical protein B0H16DRAFT_1445793 [Mycena metata]
MHVPVFHYRKQLLPTGILGTGTDTTTATAPLTTSATATDVATTTTPTAPVATDPLSGLTSIIGSIFSTSSEITTYPHHFLYPYHLATTVTATPTASPASASSASASPSATSTTSSTVGIVAGVLIGVLSLALIIGFFLRRWNRNRTRATARESINFGPEGFQKYAEQKTPSYPEAGGYQTSPTPVSYPPEAYPATYTPEPSAYAAEYNMQRQRTPASQIYSPPTAVPQIYSPHPHHGYPTAVPVAFEYQGSARPVSEQHRRGELPNPHPEYNEEDAYGGI